MLCPSLPKHNPKRRNKHISVVPAYPTRITKQKPPSGSRACVTVPADHRRPGIPKGCDERALATSLHTCRHVCVSGDGTNSIDKNSNEDGSRHLGPVLWILDAADKLVVIILEQKTESPEDDDGEHGDDHAVRGKKTRQPSDLEPSRAQLAPRSSDGAKATYQDHACMALTSGFIVGNVFAV